MSKSKIAAPPTLEAIAYQAIHSWLTGLADRYITDPLGQGTGPAACQDTIDRLANAISHQLMGSPRGWFSPIEPALAAAVREAIAQPPDSPVQPSPPPLVQALQPKSHLDSLADSQRPVGEQVLHYLRNSEMHGQWANQALLQGYAGTGKTFVLGSVVSELIDRGTDPDTILLAAPTHKACKVLSRAFADRGMRLASSTFASMLGLKPAINNATGEQFFAPDPMGEAKIRNYQTIICDEGSMVSAQLLRLINQEIDLTKRILWAGDGAQLPPIERFDPDYPDRPPEYESPVLKIPGWSLTKVVRYSGAIAYLAEDVRNNLDRRSAPPILDYAGQDDTLIRMGDRDWINVAKQCFTGDGFDSDPDRYRILAFRNAQVDQFNAAIHAHRFGPESDPFKPGEVIVAKKPCVQQVDRGQLTLLNNGEEAQIESVRQGMQEGFPIWILNCATDDEDFGVRYLTLKVLDESARDVFDKELNKLIVRAKDERDPSRRKGLWREYYEFQDKFHSVSLCYALTVHKSQGSTFGTVFVDLPDMLRHPGREAHDIMIRNKLIYTGLTRCARSAVVLG